MYKQLPITSLKLKETEKGDHIPHVLQNAELVGLIENHGTTLVGGRPENVVDINRDLFSFTGVSGAVYQASMFDIITEGDAIE